MQTFTCVHDCILNGRHVRKGARVSATPEQLKLPSHARLLQSASFRPETTPPVAAPPPAADPRAALAERRQLLQQLKDLKVTPPKDASNEALKTLIADAAAPGGCTADE